MDVLINSNVNVVVSLSAVYVIALPSPSRDPVSECGALSVRSTRRAKDAAEEIITAVSECHRCSQVLQCC